jgi:hypothetical protein
MTLRPTDAPPQTFEAVPGHRAIVLTYSSMRTWKACARKYQYSYVLGYKPVASSGPQVRGGNGHRAAEAYWLGRMAGARDATDLAVAAIEKDVDGFERAKLIPLVVGYCAAWNQYDARVWGVEQVFQASLLDPDGRPSRRYVLQGKIDLLMKVPGGAPTDVVLCEHKFTSLDASGGSDYRRRLVIDEQIDTYWIGAEALGLRVARVGYDVVRFPQLRPLQATPEDKRRYTEDKATGEKRLWARHRDHDETPAEFEARLTEDIAADPSRYYERFRVDRLPHERKRFRLNLWQESERLTHSLERDLWPMNSDACFRFGTPCEFFAVCAEGASLDDPTRYRRVESVHQELR